MKNQIKQIFIALVAVICISLCTIQVFATPDAVVDTQPVATDAPVVTEAPTVATTAPVIETTAPATEAETQPVTQAPTKATQPVTQATQTPTRATQPTVAPATQATTSYVPQTNPANNNEPDDNTPTQSTNLYDSDGRVDTDNLDEDDWADITNRLKNNNGEKSSGDDFNFIKNNSDDGDNGLWILIVGILLILAGIGTIATLIFLHIKKKNGSPKGKNGKSSSNGKRFTPEEKKQINRRSKYDTAEVNIPKRTPQRGKSPYGGTRYKPKH